MIEMMRRLRTFWQSGNLKYPIKPLNIIGLLFNVLFWYILTMLLLPYVIIFPIVGMAKAAIGKPPAWWVSS